MLEKIIDILVFLLLLSGLISKQYQFCYMAIMFFQTELLINIYKKIGDK